MYDDDRHPRGSILIQLSYESILVLKALAESGIYGCDEQEVASRFVDAALQQFVPRPCLSLGTLRRDAIRNAPRKATEPKKKKKGVKSPRGWNRL
jgi:hypothetical protein